MMEAKGMKMTPSDVLELMKKVQQGEVPYRDEPLLMAEGETCYAFCWEDPTKQRDWRADGYRWRQNGKKSKIIGGAIIKKTYFNVFTAPKQNSSKFQRIAHECNKYPNIVVILYKGDKSVAGSFPHGNRRRDSTPHVMTRPSVLEACRKTVGLPSFVKESSDAYMLPRDKIQVMNAQRGMQKKLNRINDILDKMTKAINEGSFAHQVATEPYLIITLFNTKLLKHFSAFLANMSAVETLVLSYARVYQEEDFAVSSLILRYAYSQSGIPIIFFMHKSQTSLPSEMIWEIACERIEKLENCRNVKLISDVNYTENPILVTDTQANTFRVIVNRLKNWEDSPVDAKSHLEHNAVNLYKLSLHYASIATQGKVDKRKYQEAAFSHRVFGAGNAKTVLNSLSRHTTISGRPVKRKKVDVKSHPQHISGDVQTESIPLSNIRHCLERRSFYVQDGEYEHEVKLFPVTECSCATTRNCRHVLACKKSLGMIEDVDRKTSNKTDVNSTMKEHDGELGVTINFDNDCLEDGMVMDISKEITIAHDANG